MRIETNRQSWEALASRWVDSASKLDLLQDSILHELARAIEVLGKLGEHETIDAGFAQADLDGLTDARNAFVAFCHDIHDEISERIQAPFAKDMALILDETRKASPDRFVLDGVSLEDLLGRDKGGMQEPGMNEVPADPDKDACLVPVISPQSLAERDIFFMRLNDAAKSVNVLALELFPRAIAKGWAFIAAKEQEELSRSFANGAGTILQRAFGLSGDLVLPYLCLEKPVKATDLGDSVDIKGDDEQSLVCMIAGILGELFFECTGQSQESAVLLSSQPESVSSFIKAACAKLRE